MSLPFTEIIFGDYSSGKTWGSYVYKRPMPGDFLANAAYRTGPLDLAFPPIIVNSVCSSGSGWMFRFMGYTDSNRTYSFRDVAGGGYGLSQSGWHSCYNDCYSGGGLISRQGQIMARGVTTNVDVGWLSQSCTAGVGACARTGSWVCNAAQTGTTCTATAGTPTTETCNGIDDDCNGTVDNGPSTTCAAAIDLGTLNAGATVFTRTDFVPSTAGAEQWYLVRLPLNADMNQHGTGTPQIRLVGSASLRFEVRSSCAGSPLVGGTGSPATGLTSWSFSDNAATPGPAAYTTRNIAWPATVYVRVYRVSAPTTCATQTLTVSRPTGSEYQGSFTVGVTPYGRAQCTDWNTFRASIDPARTYTSITLRSSVNTAGRTCTGAAANTLCQAIRNGHASATVSVACGGFTWTVGQCYAGQVEVNADGTFCSCSSSWAARPCHQDPNFGGVGIGSCGAANQEIMVNCQ